MVDVYDLLDILYNIVDGFGRVIERLFLPVSEWLPDAIADLPLGDTLSMVLRVFFDSTGFGNQTLLSLMFGTGLVLLITLTFVVWVIRLIT